MTIRFILLTAILFISCTANAQSQAPAIYTKWITAGDSLYQVKQYKSAAEAFSKAFAATGGRGLPYDKYNAACSWSLAGNKDSAFRLLTNITGNGVYSDIDHLNEDPDLVSLHADKRWKSLCITVQANKDKEEAKLNKPLVAILDTIFKKDQENRIKIEDIQKNYGYDSKEIRDLWKTIEKDDSINLVKVTSIIDKHGWPGPDVVGGRGNQTIFLVIQHSDQKTQEKYLPLMREAVKNNKAQPSALALLEDRVALGQGKKQLYGSQIQQDALGNSWVQPLQDPDNVDKRRAEVGLGPLADYVKHWNIKWDVEEYKKQLPEIEKKEKW